MEAKIKYYPMLFNTPMVQAIEEERKNQTRRTKGLEIINENPDDWEDDGFMMKGDIKNGVDSNVYFVFKNKITKERIDVKGFAKTGDVFWVRETYTIVAPNMIFYKADKENSEKVKWKPSIFMPKSACRIFLEITSIEVERLQDIIEEDAINEGVEKISDFGSSGYNLYTDPNASHTDIDAVWSFESLWESINGDGSWNKNPWVWVIKFKRIEKPLNFVV